MAPFPLPLLDSWTCESWGGETQYYVVDSDSEHILLLGEPCPSPESYCHPMEPVIPFSKGNSTILSTRQLWGGVKPGKFSEFWEREPTASLLCLKNVLLGQGQCCVEFHAGG